MLSRPLSVLGILFLAFLGCSRPSALQSAEKARAAGNCDKALVLYDSSFAAGVTGKDRSLAMNGKAECLLRLDRTSEAFHYFQRVLEIDPKDYQANLRSAELLANAGMAREAEPFAQSVIASRPNDGRALAVVGSVYALKGDIEKAIVTYHRILSNNPKDTSVSIALAELYANLNNEAAAEAVLLTASNSTPTSAEPLLALARMYEQMGKIEDAEKAYRRAALLPAGQQAKLRLAQFLERTSRVEEAEQVLRQADSSAEGSTALSDFHLITGRATEALLGYSVSLREFLLGQSPDSRRGATLLARSIEAELQSATDSPERSSERIANAQALLNADGKVLAPAARSTLAAEIALSRNDLLTAEKQLAEAIANDPHYVPALYLSGMVAQREGDDAKARQAWASALETDSSYAPARLALAQRNFTDGQFSAAQENVVDVVRDEPANVIALNLYARILAALKEFDSARLVCHRAMAVAPGSAEPWVTQGDIDSARSDTSSAFVDYERAVLLEPRSERAIEGLLSIYRRGRFTREMIARLEAVALNPPVSSTLLEIAGRLYAEHGWRSDAVRALRASLQADPGRSSAALALARAEQGISQGPRATDLASPALLSAFKAEALRDSEGIRINLEFEVKNGDPTGIAANNLAWLLASEGRDLDQALQLAESAHRKNPRSLQVLDTLGYIRLKRREFTEATSVLNDAASLIEFAAPEERRLIGSVIYEHLAQAWESQGRMHQAAEARAKARGV